MPFNRYPADVTLSDIARERGKDARAIELLEANKKNYRDRTGGANQRGAAPTGHNDVIEGDAVGDEYIDATYRYLLVNDPIDGVVWERFSRGSVSW